MRILYKAFVLCLFNITYVKSEVSFFDFTDKKSPIQIEKTELFEKCSGNSQFQITINRVFNGENLEGVFIRSSKKSPEFFFYRLGLDKKHSSLICFSKKQVAYAEVVATYGYSNCEGVKHTAILSIVEKIE